MKDEQVYQGTFEQLKEYFNEYILDGFVKSSEKGNKKINTEPKNMKELFGKKLLEYDLFLR